MKPAFALLIAALALTGCERETPPASAPPTSSSTPPPAQALTSQTELLLAEATSRHQTLAAKSEALRQSMQALLEQPQADRLKLARSAWRDAHQAFKATRLFSYLGLLHPEFEHASLNPVKHRLITRLDVYPLEPGYLDYVEGYPFSGLVFSESVPLTAASIKEQHQYGDEQYVVLGFHALEFLLWGENTSQESRRPWQDFKAVAAASSANPREQARQRRRQLTELVTAELHADLLALSQAWTAPQGWYRTTVEQGEITESQLRKAVAQLVQADLVVPLERLLQQAEREFDPSLVESRFSHTAEADLLATVRPLQPFLPGLGAGDVQTVARAYNRLVERLEALPATAFNPVTHELDPDDGRALEQARKAALDLLEQLRAPSGNANSPAG